MASKYNMRVDGNAAVAVAIGAAIWPAAGRTNKRARAAQNSKNVARMAIKRFFREIITVKGRSRGSETKAPGRSFTTLAAIFANAAIYKA